MSVGAWSAALVDPVRLQTEVVAKRRLSDLISMGVLASRVPRDEVEDAVEGVVTDGAR
jgi:hypothetical protein